jgi:hypothetical protein
MMALLIILLMIIALDVTALLWGVDSLDGINSLEWLRRQQKCNLFNHGMEGAGYSRVPPLFFYR